MNTLVCLTDDMLKDMGIVKIGPRAKIMEEVNRRRNSQGHKESKSPQPLPSSTPIISTSTTATTNLPPLLPPLSLPPPHMLQNDFQPPFPELSNQPYHHDDFNVRTTTNFYS